MKYLLLSVAAISLSACIPAHEDPCLIKKEPFIHEPACTNEDSSKPVVLASLHDSDGSGDSESVRPDRDDDDVTDDDTRDDTSSDEDDLTDEDGDNGHGNDPGKFDPSNPGKGKAKGRL